MDPMQNQKEFAGDKLSTCSDVSMPGVGGFMNLCTGGVKGCVFYSSKLEVHLLSCAGKFYALKPYLSYFALLSLPQLIPLSSPGCTPSLFSISHHPSLLVPAPPLLLARSSSSF